MLLQVAVNLVVVAEQSYDVSASRASSTLSPLAKIRGLRSIVGPLVS
jgi:hypothetical protein